MHVLSGLELVSRVEKEGRSKICTSNEDLPYCDDVPLLTDIELEDPLAIECSLAQRLYQASDNILAFRSEQYCCT